MTCKLSSLFLLNFAFLRYHTTALVEKNRKQHSSAFFFFLSFFFSVFENTSFQKKKKNGTINFMFNADSRRASPAPRPALPE